MAQRNGGTAGLVAAVFLAVLLIVIMSTRLDPLHAIYPPEALRMIARFPDLWGVIGIVGAVVAALSMVFAVGLFSRLRGHALTRASALTGFTDRRCRAA